jgi:hypothetical protein
VLNTININNYKLKTWRQIPDRSYFYLAHNNFLYLKISDFSINFNLKRVTREGPDFKQKHSVCIIKKKDIFLKIRNIEKEKYSENKIKLQNNCSEEVNNLCSCAYSPHQKIYLSSSEVLFFIFEQDLFAKLAHNSKFVTCYNFRTQHLKMLYETERVTPVNIFPEVEFKDYEN